MRRDVAPARRTTARGNLRRALLSAAVATPTVATPTVVTVALGGLDGEGCALAADTIGFSTRATSQ